MAVQQGRQGLIESAGGPVQEDKTTYSGAATAETSPGLVVPAEEVVQKGSSRFRPRARLMTTLGNELISSDAVALTELVKNAFDADARHVLIRVAGEVGMDGTIKPDTGSIWVLDDGHGMDRDTINDTWLEPATAHRRHTNRSPQGRRVLGEKGVGRFSVAKLGSRLELVSKGEDSDEVRLTVDWSAFEDEDRYLDEIEIELETAKAGLFDRNGIVESVWRTLGGMHLRGNIGPAVGHGTLLKISGLRSRWNQELMEEIRQSLSRLVNPFDDKKIVSGFRIVLDLPERFGTKGGLIEPPREIREPHYRLAATVDESGNAWGEMDLKDGQHLPFGPVSLLSEEEPFRCGPFTIRLNVWDRDAKSLNVLVGDDSSVRLVRETLDAAAGVSIYRSGFRILPFGEKGDDWLGLDLRRVQSPTRRLSNNQIVGYILIDRDANPDLVDQTNREGLIDGPAFHDLRSATLRLLLRLENERYDIRPRREPRPRGGGLLDRVDLGELRTAVSDAVPGDSPIPEMVADLQRDLDNRMEKIGEVLSRYHRLATLGQLIDRVVHELGQPIPTIRQTAVLGTEAIEGNSRSDAAAPSGLLGKLSRYFEIITDQARVANDVIRRIAPFGGRRRGRPKSWMVEEAIENAVALLQEEIKSVGAEIRLPDTAHRVSVDGTEIQEVLVNLLTNSLHWLKWVKRRSRIISIEVQRSPDRSLALIVEDSGPGVPESDHRRIFDPYFTTKEDGVGLGLTIAGEIVSDYYGGELELLSPGDLGGARFRATLRRRV